MQEGNKIESNPEFGQAVLTAIAEGGIPANTIAAINYLKGAIEALKKDPKQNREFYSDFGNYTTKEILTYILSIYQRALIKVQGVN